MLKSLLDEFAGSRRAPRPRLKHWLGAGRSLILKKRPRGRPTAGRERGPSPTEGKPSINTYRNLGLGLLLLTTSTIAACSAKSGEGDEGAEPQELVVSVTVENRNFQDMNIFVIRGSSRVRLGMVASMSTQTFRMRSEMMRSTQVRLVADPIGVFETYESEILRIEPGDQIKWTLSASLTNSAIFVF